MRKKSLLAISLVLLLAAGVDGVLDARLRAT